MGDNLIFVPRQNGKIFLKTGKAEFEWMDIGGATIDALTADESTKDFHTAIIKVKYHIDEYKARIAFLQLVGLAKPPRCTYKTIKRNCAKRNR